MTVELSLPFGRHTAGFTMPVAAMATARHPTRRLAAILGALCAVVAPMASAEVDERFQETFYVVNARPDVPVSTLINQASYLTQGGRTFHGRVTPDYRWKLFWDVDATTGLCRMTRALVTLRIEVRYPRLFDATDAQRAAFEQYMAPLRVHEQGHLSRYRATADQMVRELEALPPMADCESLRKTAFDLSNAIIREGQEANVQYDAETQHGRKQGTG